jgi:hypothetical protein
VDPSPTFSLSTSGDLFPLPPSSAAALDGAFVELRALTAWQAESEVPEGERESLPQHVEELASGAFKLQHRATDVRLAQKRATLLANSSLSDRARLVGLGSKESSAYLSALPSEDGNLMSNSSFVLALLRRLGAGLPFHIDSGAFCVCGKPLADDDGFHLEVCGCASSRHDHLVRLIFDMLLQVGFSGKLEPSFLFVEDKKRPDILIRSLVRRGDRWSLDVVVAHPEKQATIQVAAYVQGAVAVRAAGAKNTKYVPACERVGMGFLPLVFEVHGAFGEDLKALIKTCRERVEEGWAGALWKGRGAEWERLWKERLSVALQDGTSEMVVDIASKSGLSGRLEEGWHGPEEWGRAGSRGERGAACEGKLGV